MENCTNTYTANALRRVIEAGCITHETKAICIDRDCLLTETSTERSLTYHVINYRTFEKKYLGYRSKEADKNYLIMKMNKIRTCDFYDTTIPTEGTALITFIFTQLFPEYGFTLRKDQVDVAIQMYRVMKERSISLNDIPVGLGKTHAYLVAAIVYNLTNKRNMLERSNLRSSTTARSQEPMPIILTTSSIQLQKAIEKEYIPCISKMLLENGITKDPITSIQRKGKENYICDMRLKNYVNSLDETKKPEKELQALQSLRRGFRIDLTEISSITNYDKRKINVMADRCYQCNQISLCRFQNHMQEARSNRYNIQICNHNYYLADVLRRKQGLRSLLPDYKAVIIDEAHKFNSAAEDMYGTTLNKKQLVHMIQKAKPEKCYSTREATWTQRAKEGHQFVEHIFNELIEQLEQIDPLEKVDVDETLEKFAVTMTSAIKSDINRLRLLLEELATYQPLHKVFLIAELKRCAKEMETLIKVSHICWLEGIEQNEDLHLVTVIKELASTINDDVFSKEVPFILTSGTIAVQDDFSYFARGIGLEETKRKNIQYVTKKSPFDFLQNCLMYLPSSIPYPNIADEAYIHRIVEEIDQLIRASHGHALVLFTSYSSMKKVYAQLQKKDFDFPVFPLLKGKSQAIQDFRESKNGVLLATGAAWEGIDFKGDIVSQVIIVKLPFLVPDPMTQEQKKQYETMEEFKEKILIPRMLIRLKQGVGRAIRSETDTAVISILDSRAQGKYKEVVMDALPKCKVTKEINEVKEFIHSKKKADYFD